MNFNPGILRTYASTGKPELLPKDAYITHTPYTTTIYDLYPKALFHFLVLPRVLNKGGKSWSSKEDNKEDSKDKEGDDDDDNDGMALLASLNARDLKSLRNLLNIPSSKRRSVHALLLRIKEDANCVQAYIQDEMRKEFGFAWDIYMGFHAVQSMDHMHLHVISSDFCSPRLKTKKHYNSFHPKLGFFLHLDEVLSWFEVDESGNPKQNVELNELVFKEKLKEPLICHHCGREQKNIVQLKTDLQVHFDNLKMTGPRKSVSVKRGYIEVSESSAQLKDRLEPDGSATTSNNNEIEDSIESEELPKRKRKRTH